MSTQSFITLGMVTPKALQILENSCAFLPLVNRQYDSQYAVSGAKIGSNLQIKLPVRYVVNDGNVFAPQSANQFSTTLVVATQKNIPLQFSSAEMALDVDFFYDTYLKPAVSQIASTVDYTIGGLYKQIYNSVGTPGTTPSTTAVLGQALAKLRKGGAPVTGETPSFVMNADANYQLVEAMSGRFNPVDKISAQFNSGLVYSNILGYGEMRLSQSINNHLTGSRLATGTLVNGTLSTQGVTSINIDGDSGAATILEGDVFTIAGVYAVNPQTRESTGDLQQFVCTASNTASSGAWTGVTFQPAIYTTGPLQTVTAFPADNAAVTFMGAPSVSYPQNLVFFKNAIAFATARLEAPEGAATTATAEYKGVSMRTVKFYDGINDMNATRLDLLYGGKTIRPELAVRIWG